MTQLYAWRWWVHAAEQGGQNYLTKGHKLCVLYVISVFRREVDGNFSLSDYYAASSGNLLPTFRDTLSAPSSGVEMEPIGSPETISLFRSLYMFRPHVLIIRRSKLHYTASGIITAVGGRLVHRCTRRPPTAVMIPEAV